MLVTLHTVADTVLFAADVEINAEPSKSPVVGLEIGPLLNLAVSGVFLASVAGVVFYAGKFAWEKWSGSSSGSGARTFLLCSLVALAASAGLAALQLGPGPVDMIAAGIGTVGDDVAELGPIGIVTAILLGVFIACVAVVVLLRRRIGAQEKWSSGSYD